MAESIPITSLIPAIIPKLSSSNYLQWRNLVVSNLASHDLLEFVDGSPPPSGFFTTDDGGKYYFSNPAYANWYAKDQCILRLLHSTLTDESMAKVLACKSSREVWLALEATFGHPSWEEILLNSLNRKGTFFQKNKKRKAKGTSLDIFDDGGDGDGGGVVSLDDDASREILLRLPVKSLSRFKSVCKSWRSLIRAHYFGCQYTLRRLHRPQPLLLVTRYSHSPLITKEKAALLMFNPIINEISGKLRTIPISIDDINNSEILNCSNGLMLLRFQYDNGYYVHNPATNRSKKLILAYHEKYIHVVSLHLVFDPSKSLHYEIVCIRAEEEPSILLTQSYLIEVFNSESGTWRVCVEPFTSDERMNFSACVQCNNLVYMMHGKPGHSSVYTFDIVKNVSELIVFREPKYPRKLAYSHSLQESNGCLYYSALVRDGLHELAAVWELQVNGDDPRQSTWLLKYENRVRLLNGLRSSILIFIAETSTVLIRVLRKIVAYDFLGRSYKELLDLDTEAYASVLQFGEFKAYLNVYQFGETIALI